MMAFVSADRRCTAASVLEAQVAATDRDDDNAMFTHDVGRPLTLAIKAFGEGDYAEAVRRLRPIRYIACRFDGSHAQRDLLDLTQIESAFRSIQSQLASALVAERIDAKPASPWARTLRERSLSRAA